MAFFSCNLKEENQKRIQLEKSERITESAFDAILSEYMENRKIPIDSLDIKIIESNVFINNEAISTDLISNYIAAISSKNDIVRMKLDRGEKGDFQTFEKVLNICKKERSNKQKKMIKEIFNRDLKLSLNQQIKLGGRFNIRFILND